ncbi:hypothetical protein AtEden1_Chr1g0041351 [Arabidopsis thaliana]
MISQMHWIVTHFNHKNIIIAVYGSKEFFVGFSLFWEKIGFLLFNPLLGQNGYKCCLNTPNPSSNFIISQMHWIVTHFEHRNANKAIYYF